MADSIRHLVSKKKKRYEQDGFDLDLTYVGDRMIAMGFPASSIEGVYRNNMKDVQRFFKEKHTEDADGDSPVYKFKIYNLCSEREYDANKFHGACTRFPFDDHNPCPLSMLPAVCEDMHDFLQADEDNVVAIHCKAGKGRTGLVCSAFFLHEALAGTPLMHDGEAVDTATANDALDFFAAARTDDGKGVTIPSQQRWVRYYEQMFADLAGGETLEAMDAVTCNLQRIVLMPAPDFDRGGGCDAYVKVLMDGEEVFKSDVGEHVKGNVPIEIEVNQELHGNVKLVFSDKDRLSDDKMCHLWFHPRYLWLSTQQTDAAAGTVVFTKNEVDGAVKDKNHKHFAEDFTITLYFAPEGDAE